ncbi:MAG: hypothetical protein A3H99_13140 [Gallionellales bacterium RIFCSPLOWO2_02_FULL_59_110]|nr:MAG: hypothetical protein A3H99_13140 [Gallionellales bacterium RIFCSPLOWO2_02_FULL_59_110]
MTHANQSPAQTNKTALRAGSSDVPVIGKANPKTKLEAASAVHKLRGFIGRQQLVAIGELCRGEERQFFIDKLVELAELVGSMPVTYETDGQGAQAIVWLHYFTPGGDWYITERDVLDEQLQAFGMADLGCGGELGYISIVELLACGVELDLHWQPRSLAVV